MSTAESTKQSKPQQLSLWCVGCRLSTTTTNVWKKKNFQDSFWIFSLGHENDGITTAIALDWSQHSKFQTKCLKVLSYLFWLHTYQWRHLILNGSPQPSTQDQPKTKQKMDFFLVWWLFSIDGKVGSATTTLLRQNIISSRISVTIVIKHLCHWTSSIWYFVLLWTKGQKRSQSIHQARSVELSQLDWLTSSINYKFALIFFVHQRKKDHGNKDDDNDKSKNNGKV